MQYSRSDDGRQPPARIARKQGAILLHHLEQIERPARVVATILDGLFTGKQGPMSPDEHAEAATEMATELERAICGIRRIADWLTSGMEADSGRG